MKAGRARFETKSAKAAQLKTREITVIIYSLLLGGD